MLYSTFKLLISYLNPPWHLTPCWNMLFGASSRSLWNKATHSSTNNAHKSYILWSRASHDFDNVMLWAALCLGFWGLCIRGSSLAHATTAARLGVSDSLIKTLGLWKSSAFMLYIRTPCSDLHGYRPCLVSSNSLGTTGPPPISYSGCLIYVYIFCMCGCPFKVRSIHIFRAMNG